MAGEGMQVWVAKQEQETAALKQQIEEMKNTSRKLQNTYRALATVQLEPKEKILRAMQMLKDNHPDEFPETHIAAQGDKQQRFLRNIPKWTGTGIVGE